MWPGGTLAAIAAMTILAALPAQGGAKRHASDHVRAQLAAKCANFVVFRGEAGGDKYHFTATRVRRKGRVSCRRARYMLRGTYFLDRGKVIRHKVGRPTVAYRGGWRCSNGAGGASCSNTKHAKWLITANVGYVDG